MKHPAHALKLIDDLPALLLIRVGEHGEVIASDFDPLSRSGKCQAGERGEQEAEFEQIIAHDFRHSVTEACFAAGAELCSVASATQMIRKSKRPSCNLQIGPFCFWL